MTTNKKKSDPDPVPGPDPVPDPVPGPDPVPDPEPDPVVVEEIQPQEPVENPAQRGIEEVFQRLDQMEEKITSLFVAPTQSATQPEEKKSNDQPNPNPKETGETSKEPRSHSTNRWRIRIFRKRG